MRDYLNFRKLECKFFEAGVACCFVFAPHLLCCEFNQNTNSLWNLPQTSRLMLRDKCKLLQDTLVDNTRHRMEGEAGVPSAGAAMQPRAWAPWAQALGQRQWPADPSLWAKWEPAGQGQRLLPSPQPFVTPQLRGWLHPWRSPPQRRHQPSGWGSKESNEGFILPLEPNTLRVSHGGCATEHLQGAMECLIL